MEIITIKDLDKLKAKLEVVGNEPDLETKRSKITVQLGVSYPAPAGMARARARAYWEDKSLEVYVGISEDQIEKFTEAFEDAKTLVSNELDDIKSELKPLQAIPKSFDISLEAIFKRIYDELLKFFEMDEPESGGQGRVGL